MVRDRRHQICDRSGQIFEIRSWSTAVTGVIAAKEASAMRPKSPWIEDFFHSNNIVRGFVVETRPKQGKSPPALKLGLQPRRSLQTRDLVGRHRPCTDCDARPAPAAPSNPSGTSSSLTKKVGAVSTCRCVVATSLIDRQSMRWSRGLETNVLVDLDSTI